MPPPASVTSGSSNAWRRLIRARPAPAVSPQADTMARSLICPPPLPRHAYLARLLVQHVEGGHSVDLQSGAARQGGGGGEDVGGRRRRPASLCLAQGSPQNTHRVHGVHSHPHVVQLPRQGGRQAPCAAAATKHQQVCGGSRGRGSRSSGAAQCEQGGACRRSLEMEGCRAALERRGGPHHVMPGSGAHLGRAAACAAAPGCPG